MDAGGARRSTKVIESIRDPIPTGRSARCTPSAAPPAAAWRRPGGRHPRRSRQIGGRDRVVSEPAPPGGRCLVDPPALRPGPCVRGPAARRRHGAASAARLLSDDGGPASQEHLRARAPWNTGGRAGSDWVRGAPLRRPAQSRWTRRAPASHSNSTRAVPARSIGSAARQDSRACRKACRGSRCSRRCSVSWLHPNRREPRTWLRHPGQRASDAAGPACARRVHRDVPLLGRRRNRRHLPDAGGPVPAGIHAPAAPCAAGRQRSIGRHGRQRHPQLRARRVRDLRPGSRPRWTGCTRGTATACMPFGSRSTTSRGRGATCCTSTSTTGRSSRDCGAAVSVTSRRCSRP